MSNDYKSNFDTDNELTENKKKKNLTTNSLN